MITHVRKGCFSGSGSVVWLSQRQWNIPKLQGMMTSSNGNFFALFCVGKPPVTGGFPSQRPVTRSFDVFFDVRLNKCPSNQSRCWRFETWCRSLWCHNNGAFTGIKSQQTRSTINCLYNVAVNSKILTRLVVWWLLHWCMLSTGKSPRIVSNVWPLSCISRVLRFRVKNDYISASYVVTL